MLSKDYHCDTELGRLKHPELSRIPSCVSQLCPSIVNGCLIGSSTLVHGKKPPPHPYVVVSLGGLKEAYTSVPPAT